MKVNGINELAQMVEYDNMVRNHERKAKKILVAERVATLIAEGVNEEVAKVLANVEFEYNI